jgi:Fur family ferric uptake transcriptional regulator
MSCEQALFEQLRNRGFRLTPQREMVLSVMHKMEDFATAEQIYDRVQELSTSVDISTIYRTLDLFQDFHVVATLDSGDGQRRFRLSVTDGHHLHLVCRACGAVIGLDHDQAQTILHCLNAERGFQADLENLTIPGLCRDCHQAQSATRNP